MAQVPDWRTPYERSLAHERARDAADALRDGTNAQAVAEALEDSLDITAHLEALLTLLRDDVTAEQRADVLRRISAVAGDYEASHECDVQREAA